MKKVIFLSKLKKSGQLDLVRPSNEVCDSYLEKSGDCLKSAKILVQNNLYENSVIMAYYAMYNSLLALFFKAGIKCENHTGSILLIKLLFKKEYLFKVISSAKEERIDKQYYVKSKKDTNITSASVIEMIENAEKFIIQIRLILKSLTNKDIEVIRNIFDDIV